MASSSVDSYFPQKTKSNPPDNVKHHIVTQSKINQYATLITSILSLVSILVLLVLNLTSLIKLYKDSNEVDTCKTYFHDVANSIGGVKNDLNAEMKPKINIISSSVSYDLPNMITAAENNIINNVLKNCIPYEPQERNDTCPDYYAPQFHSPSFALLNTDLVDRCLTTGGTIRVSNQTQFLNYPSFIPQSTTPDGCIRIPSFSLSSTIFSYTHNVVLKGCADHGKSYETWILGYIGSSYAGTPEPKASQTWDMGSFYNRKTCSTVAGSDYGWLGCVVVNETEKNDYSTAGSQPLTISYQNLRGIKKEWLFQYDELQIDREYTALYFSVGSGIIVGNKVYFLMYGGLAQRYEADSHCVTQGCQSFTQDQCNKADSPWWSGYRQIVNAIMVFEDDPNRRPSPTITTVTPLTNWMGAEGRLMYNWVNNKAMIYTRSSSWHTRLQIGFIDLEPPHQIEWQLYSSITRPGEGGCHGNNLCPIPCVTGVYADAFPLTSDLRLVVSAVHTDPKIRKNPRIVSANPNAITGFTDIYNGDQAADYTTTTCFLFGNDIWCLSIIEVPLGGAKKYSPIPYLYKLETSCKRQANWFEINRNAYFNAIRGLIDSFKGRQGSDDGIVPTPTVILPNLERQS